MKSSESSAPGAADETAPPVLYVFSGLPGVGKTTLARRLAKRRAAVYLRIDTIEQALLDLCSFTAEGEGYRLSYRVAADNLLLGNSVVADCCNTIELTRREWADVARNNKATCCNIEIACTDASEHRRRVETRDSSIEGLFLPGWAHVQEREYEPWQSDRIVVDTSGKSPDESFDELMTRLANAQSVD